MIFKILSIILSLFFRLNWQHYARSVCEYQWFWSVDSNIKKNGELPHFFSTFQLNS